MLQQHKLHVTVYFLCCCPKFMAAPKLKKTQKTSCYEMNILVKEMNILITPCVAVSFLHDIYSVFVVE